MTNTVRRNGYIYLNEPSIEHVLSLAINLFLALAIVINILVVVLASVGEIAQQMGNWSIIANYVFAVIFGAEYLVRVWVAAETPHEELLSPWRKRWQYMTSAMGLIDLLSFIPILMLIALPQGLFGDLRILKIISMVRVLKLTRYSASLSILASVYRENKNTLFAAGLVMMILAFMAATGIYLFERYAQPDVFGSIPASMWWAFVTLTTVGYGDMAPVTLGGKIFGTLVMVCGVGIAAMPAGIFASSFVQLIREQEHERRLKRRALKHKQAAELSEEQQRESNLQVILTRSEQREVDYLMAEYGLSLDQGVGVVTHFRH